MTGTPDSSGFHADERWTARGPIGAPLVAFIHPTRLNRTFWAPQLDALGSTMRVVAVDLPGHGRLESERFTLAAAVDLVRAAIETERARVDLASAPTVIVGLSLGGYVAIALAADVPSIADALVLAGATAEPIGARAKPFRALAVALERANPRLFDRISSAYIRQRHPGPAGDQIVASGFAYRGAAEALRSLAGERFLPRLAAYPGPVVLVNGRGDLAMRPGEPDFLAAAQRGRLVHVPGAYHLSSLERPRAFTAIVRSVVAEVVAGSAEVVAGSADRAGSTEATSGGADR